MMRSFIAAVLVGVALTALVDARPAEASTARSTRAAERNCSDFADQRAAQRHFVRRGGPRRDPDGLDSDGNGVACESRPCPCSKKRSPKPKRPQVIAVRVVEVHDGGTIRVRAFGARRRFYTVRLAGIEAPTTLETSPQEQCGGRRSSAALARLVFGALADADGDGHFDAGGGPTRPAVATTEPAFGPFDARDRLVAHVRLDAGPDLATAQLRRGWARALRGEPRARRRGSHRRAERAARRARRGLWRSCSRRR